MELKEFITQTILDVAGGIRDAKEKLPNNYSGWKPQSERQHYEEQEKQIDISFALTIGETSSAGNKSGLSVIFATIGAGVKTETGQTSQETNKVSFTIPIVVPIVSGDIVKRD